MPQKKDCQPSSGCPIREIREHTIYEEASIGGEYDLHLLRANILEGDNYDQER
jgi:hypothetical protein